MSPHSYTDKASEFVQEASTLQASVGKQDADDVSIPISHIDGRFRASAFSPAAVASQTGQDARRQPVSLCERGATSHCAACENLLLSVSVD